ncbi:MAG: OmpA family protein [Pseudomonadota bacterium]
MPVTLRPLAVTGCAMLALLAAWTEAGNGSETPQLIDAAAAPAVKFELRRTAIAVIASGDIASPMHGESLRRAIAKRFPDVAPSTQFDALLVLDADWQLLTLAAVDLLAETAVASVELTPARARISGVAPRESLFDTRLARLRAVAGPDYPLEVSVLRANPRMSPAEACKTMFRSIRGEPVRFESGTAELRTSSYALLDRYVSFARDCPAKTLKITGHSDSAGDEAFNLALSRQRAQRVVSYLVAAGVSGDRLAHEAAGSSRPVADNGSAWGRSLNRRIEFELLEPAS